MCSVYMDTFVRCDLSNVFLRSLLIPILREHLQLIVSSITPYRIRRETCEPHLGRFNFLLISFMQSSFLEPQMLGYYLPQCRPPPVPSTFHQDYYSLILIIFDTLTHWGRLTQICVFNTRLFSLHNTLNYAIHRACLRMVLLTDVYRNLTLLWINL